MEHLPQLILDLALLLTAAAVATVLCKKFKQPLVLGYVLAGFLVSPAIGWLPNIQDTENVQTWSEIGVIFLMFGLGLEFSIMRLTSVGKPAVLTALNEMLLMTLTGLTVGLLLGWDFFTSLFLGGMLAISSTTIIIKTFDELGMRNRKFSELVFGSLIIEDIMGIFFMVFLSTIAVGTATDGGAIALEIGKMGLYLIIWFVLSVIFVPLVLRKIAAALTDEIMLVASVALCLLMVVLANQIGFSAALGAFMAGSILAGTPQAHKMEELFKPTKDLFGAVFFVSVGMLVSPQMIAENALSIVIVVLVVLIFKPLFSTLGALIAKESLSTAVHTGMSLSQIGEFSFIIAALGVTLGVTADFLYPLIVAVSVVTTIATPFYVRASDKVYEILNKVLPKSLIAFFAKRSEEAVDTKGGSMWMDYVKHVFIKALLVVLVGLAAVVLMSSLLAPLLLNYLQPLTVEIITEGIALLITGAFVANLFYGFNKGLFGILWLKKKRSRARLILLFLFCVLMSAGMVYYVVISLAGSINSLWLIAIAFVLTIIMARSRKLHAWFLHIETSFIGNLNEGAYVESRKAGNSQTHEEWIRNQLSFTQVKANNLIKHGDKHLPADFAIAHSCNLTLVSVEREGKHLENLWFQMLPRMGLFSSRKNNFDGIDILEGDVLTFIGTNDDVDLFLQNLANASVEEIMMNKYSFDEFIEAENTRYGETEEYLFQKISVEGSHNHTINTTEPFSAQTCLVLAIDHETRTVLMPNGDTPLSQEDDLWCLQVVTDKSLEKHTQTAD